MWSNFAFAVSVDPPIASCDVNEPFLAHNADWERRTTIFKTIFIEADGPRQPECGLLAAMTSLLKAIFGNSGHGMERSPSFDDLSMGAKQHGG